MGKGRDFFLGLERENPDRLSSLTSRSLFPVHFHASSPLGLPVFPFISFLPLFYPSPLISNDLIGTLQVAFPLFLSVAPTAELAPEGFVFPRSVAEVYLKQSFTVKCVSFSSLSLFLVSQSPQFISFVSFPPVVSLSEFWTGLVYILLLIPLG